MKKMFEKDSVLHLGGILFAITLGTALLLGMVNGVTIDRIAAAKLEKTNSAMKMILPEADTFDEIDAKTDDESVTGVYEAKKGGSTIGYVVKDAPAGFGGVIELVVGISPENKVLGVQILEMSETAGIGTKTKNEDYLAQFKGKGGPITVVKNAASGDTQVSAISGATISSKAVASGVQTALETISALKG